MIPSYLNFNIKKFVEKLLPSNKRVPHIIAWLNALVSPIIWRYKVWRFDYLEGSLYNAWQDGNSYVKGDRILYKFSSYECLQDTSSARPTNRTYWLKLTDTTVGIYDRLTYTAQKMSLEDYLNRWFNNQGSATLIFIEHNENKIQGSYFSLETENFHVYFANESEIVTFVLGDSYVLGDIVDDNGSFFYCVQNNAGEPTDNLIYWESYQYFSNESFALSDNDFTVYVPLSLYDSLGTTTAQKDASVSAQVDKYNFFGVFYDIKTY